MDKLLSYPGKTEKGVFTFLLNEERGYLEKTASQYHPTVAAYINSARKIPGVTQVLLTALGAGEFWGDNVNGDFFGEDQLAHEGDDYGFRTFQSLAKVYKHHVNKDPRASYGDVLLAVYNPIYHRVELVVGIRHKDAPDIIDRIESGDYPVWSMGCKIPFDVCNICGNKAPNRKFYCDHLRYQLGQIDPDTKRKVYAINIKPRFFDISYVLIPADKSAMTLKKVAFAVNPGFILDAHGNPIRSSAEAADKVATISKSSTITKEVPTNAPPSSAEVIDPKLRQLAETVLDMKEREQPLPTHVLDRLAGMGSLKEIVSTLMGTMIYPKPQEFQRIILIQRGQRDLADKLDQLNCCFDPRMAAPPQSVPYAPESIRPDIVDILMPYFSDRSAAPALMLNRMNSMLKQADERPPQRHFLNESNVENPGVLSSLMLMAALYAALQGGSGDVARHALHLAASHPNAAAALAGGVTALRMERPQTPMHSLKGRFAPDFDMNPDYTSINERIERLSAKPYVKIADGEAGASLRRLALVPAVMWGSNKLQRHKNMHPDEEEGMVRKFVREHPLLTSAALVADARLAEKGKGTSALFKPLVQARKAFTSGARLYKHGSDLLKAANVVTEDERPAQSKSASIQDYAVGSLVWPVALGTANLPGRIVGSIFDQAVLDAGQKLVERSKQRKQST